jgi:hypothetical protein
MPSIKDQSTVEAIAREYCSNGRDKANAMRTIGYAESSCKSGKAVGDVYGNLRVKDAIRAIDVKSAKIAEFSLCDYQQQLREDRAMAIELKQPSACVSASVAMGRSCGFDKDVQGIVEQPFDMTEAERAEIHAAGERFNDIRLSKPKTA